ncbi:sigma-70 family RNA polymerase sigma factor [Kribbella sp. CA-293567]|uniref:sigma-70 family RNA polymerase sigma factor n=1 Tax=Kribbella sp. CA-293567 TaxID=3002436 RepID=UPI0022DD3BAC|nr:sigma-70 family RNA polymerase sigma factor [Kribbella sp. CA-293567]WBQ08303.1 sigma-70 family RNA polymerase sigma factor [Kribbella sp. CA-293567]
MTTTGSTSLQDKESPAVEQRRREQQAAEVERILREAATATGDRRARLLDQAILLDVPMARTLASRYYRRGVDTDDVNQVAYMGLVKAANGYRPGPETDFRSYAIPTIRGEIRRYFRDRAWMVRPPRRIQEIQSELTAAEGELASTLHRWPTDHELADAIGVPVDHVIDAKRAQGCFRPSSLDAPLPSTPTLSLASTLADDCDTYQLVDSIEALRPVVADLPDRDRLILHRRFVDHRTQAEIGAEIGVSQMQVSRLLREIILLLRSALVA